MLALIIHLLFLFFVGLCSLSLSLSVKEVPFLRLHHCRLSPSPYSGRGVSCQPCPAHFGSSHDLPLSLSVSLSNCPSLSYSLTCSLFPPLSLTPSLALSFPHFRFMFLSLYPSPFHSPTFSSSLSLQLPPTPSPSPIFPTLSHTHSHTHTHTHTHTPKPTPSRPLCSLTTSLCLCLGDFTRGAQDLLCSG